MGSHLSPLLQPSMRPRYLLLHLSLVIWTHSSQVYSDGGLDALHLEFTPPRIGWKEFDVNFSSTSASAPDYFKGRSGNQVRAEDLLGGQKLYVSIAVMSQRVKQVSGVLSAILSGSVVPTHTYLILSDHKFLLDQGVKPANLPIYLKFLVHAGLLTIVYTENTGPHRKLLPILSKYWSQDVVLVTFDDDRSMPRDSLLRLIKYYLKSDRQSVVGLRVRRIGFCTTTSSASGIKSRRRRSGKKRASSSLKLGLAEYGACRWPRVQNRFVMKELLVLPTGNGGVLYRPRFFHPIVFDPQLRNLTQWNDDLTFRLATLLRRVKVVPGCCDDDFSYCQDVLMSMKEAASRRTESLYDQNQARNSLMWRQALAFLTPKLLNMSALIREHLALERSICGIDSDSPLKSRFQQRGNTDMHKNVSSLSSLVGLRPLLDDQKSRREGNKCGIHWCNSKEKSQEFDWVEIVG